MKNKILIAIFFSIFLLIAPNVQAASYTDNQTVDANKTWTVKFTSDVGFDDLTKQGITVTDSTGATVSGVGLQLGEDNKTVIVTAPEGGYTPGKSYTLTVGKKAHSSTGTQMKQDRAIHFSIKNDVTISKIDNITATVKQNDSYTLPSTVTAVMSDGSIKSVSVTWDSVADTSIAGTYTYTGTVNGYSGKVKMTLEVNNLSQSINYKVTIKEDLFLPIQSIYITLDSNVDSSKYDVYLKDIKASYQNGYFYTRGQGYDKYTIRQYITIKPKVVETPKIIRVNDLEINIAEGDNYSLPSTVTANMSDGSVQDVDVTWDKTLDTSKIGTFIFYGTVKEYNDSNTSNPIVLTINVKEPNEIIEKIDNINVDVKKNDKYQLPTTVKAVMEDNSIKEVSIFWDKQVDISKAGTFTFNGTVKGYNDDKVNSPVILTVTVKEPSEIIEKINNINVTVSKGDKYQLPTTVKAVMADKSIKEVSIFWDKQVDTSEEGTFYFHGTVNEYNSNVTLVLTVSTPVTFKDEHLEYAIRIRIIKGSGTIIYKSDLLISDLNARNLYIRDLSGIENLTKIEKLDLSDNQISDISLLKGLTNLKTLYLSENQISDINVLQGLGNLEDLYLYHNQISDISLLKGLTNLKTLYLNENQISDISALKGLTNLKRLDLSGNRISDISALKGLTNLQVLNLRYNQISDISALSSLTNLQELYLSNNQISYDNIQSLRNALPNCSIGY